MTIQAQITRLVEEQMAKGLSFGEVIRLIEDSLDEVEGRLFAELEKAVK